MSERDQPVTVYLTDAEKRQLKDWADNTGKSLSHLCREAILEYTDHDRTARVEDQVRDLHDKVDTLLAQSDGEHTHTNAHKHSSIPETTRAIARAIYDRYEMPVQDQQVELAIEDIGGADDRTVRQYRSQLKKRGLLFEHPVSPVWTDDKTEWARWQDQATAGGDLYDVTDEYGMTTDEYQELIINATND
jgi:hypothetical protein